MIYHFAPHLLLRMPVRTPADYAAGRQYFLNDAFFLSAVQLASPVFYASLHRQGFRSESLSEKETVTLQKYINRYCFRPTPFGLFASVSLIGWQEVQKTTGMIPAFRLHTEPSMPLRYKLDTYFTAQAVPDELRFEANPSLYRILNEYRFYRTGLNGSGTQREYQLQSIAFSRVLKELITLCATPASRANVVAQIIRSADCSAADAEGYTDFLLDAQLLLDSKRLNITGEDRLPDLFPSAPALTQEVTPEVIERTAAMFSYLLPADIHPPEKLSVILKRENPLYILQPDDQAKLREGVTALKALTPVVQGINLSQFIKDFQKHFEGQSLPLMQALDPEAGIGYQQPEAEPNNPLLETLLIPQHSKQISGDGWSKAHALLMESWLRQPSGHTVMRLQDADLEKLRTEQAEPPILGMSLLFRKAGEQVFIENAGGINAPALMGRFTVADEQIAHAARSMAAHLEASNPDLIFAELLHLADPHTDNVNRRAHVYKYEIPITAASTLPLSNQLQLSDLYVKIVDNKAVLFSKEHRKTVIPRLTSAYNHGLNKLPLFRFLADLSYQHGRSGLGLDLRQFFPGLGFYPRVIYKNAILSLATWVLSPEQAGALQSDQTAATSSFVRLSDMIRLPRFFSLAEGDQELVFDGQDPDDQRFFTNCIRNKKEVVLKEFIFRDQVAQFNAYLLPGEPLSIPAIGHHHIAASKIQRKYVPGSSWLYLKVYAPRIGVNRLLLQLRPLLSKKYGPHQIGQWFYIRYEDHAPHIRLRLQVDPAAINDILLAFKNKLEDRIQQHVIREFQIDVYNRELERYEAGGIENSERFFWASSELILSFLKRQKKDPALTTHDFALYTVHVIISTFIPGPDQQIDFTRQSFLQFLPEFNSKHIKVDLDKKYRELSAGIFAAMGKTDPALLSNSAKAGKLYEQSLEKINMQWRKTSELPYVQSLIHMHLNRLFTEESRKQEMICYYLLHKYLVSVKGRRNRQKRQPINDPS